MTSVYKGLESRRRCALVHRRGRVGALSERSLQSKQARLSDRDQVPYGPLT